MRLSTKGRYAVMAMADLARRQAALAEGDRAVTLAEIAARQQISLSYLEQLFARLRRRGLVKSLRGPGGGYRLAREAEHTNIADIVMAVDEPLRATRCGKSKGCMLKGERCMTHDLWEEMGRQLETYLASVSLEDLVSGRLSDRESRAA
ncbi:MAG: Rrf2 family transcriptional regulator [Brevundimonas sp.]|jgi:Rrf2 family iron-sulfur cluster assembly transcriptional regulator|uniref:Rrf2 family transcriptional regulator n=1 Tax=Phenylobacterium sp. TaxID=1871053 RepID=UPI001204B4E6|nr:Rrf2 family transcriptional regulator [Phenylobacterium sp.]MDP1598250.1 Rrf2 family transcriptional regulator [Phenylobacterium sp.]MDP3591843.1 Rrf2 family transcriptional regulator [Phenylobacterium sp.]RZJ93417.1 MAG: Rrf2 family transcriptional regulator [Brevundimonas sp.]